MDWQDIKTYYTRIKHILDALKEKTPNIAHRSKREAITNLSILKLMYKQQNYLPPEIFNDYFTQNDKIHKHNTRQSDVLYIKQTSNQKGKKHHKIPRGCSLEFITHKINTDRNN